MFAKFVFYSIGQGLHVVVGFAIIIAILLILLGINMETNALKAQIQDLKERTSALRRYL